MSIRIFINRWTESQNGDVLHIHDPIDDYLANISLSAPVVSRNYYARIGITKRPDRVYLIKLMKGDLLEAEWDALSSLAGVRAMPAFRFDAPISTVSSSIKNRIYNALDSLGIPRTTFDSAPTIGAFLRNVLRELDDELNGFGDDELAPEEWG